MAGWSAGEEIVLQAVASGSLRGVILRPTCVFGPGDRVLADSRAANLAPFIIGKGDAMLDWVDVWSVAWAHRLALLSTAIAPCVAAGQRYNVGCGVPLSYRGFLGDTDAQLGWWGHPPPRHLPLRVVQALAWVNEMVSEWLGIVPLDSGLSRMSIAFTQRSWTVDIAATRRDIGYEPLFATTADAIARCVDLFRARVGNDRAVGKKEL